MTNILSPQPSQSQDLPFSDFDFDAIASGAKVKFGLDLARTKKHLVYARLCPRVRANNLTSFEEYTSLLESSEGETERQEFISALTTNVTHFFREAHHFEFLQNHVLKNLTPKLNRREPVRIWSAGCSTGQEAVSIAITLLESVHPSHLCNLQILATDVDRQVVREAANSHYSQEEISKLRPEIRQKYFIKDPDCQTAPCVNSLITYGQLNLLGEWPSFRGFDVIFCRNVAIYFDQKTRSRLWQKIQKVLLPDGLLFIGHSERLEKASLAKFKPVSITTYQKSRNLEDSF